MSKYKSQHLNNSPLGVGGIHSQSFHQQRVTAAFIIEYLMRIIGKHVDTKLLKMKMKVINTNYLRRKLSRNKKLIYALQIK